VKGKLIFTPPPIQSSSDRGKGRNTYNTHNSECV
jgi:hypothetical protein